MRAPNPRSARRRFDSGFSSMSPPAAVAIGLIFMGILTAIEINKTMSARHTVRHGWGQGVLIGLTIALVPLLVLVFIRPLKNRKVRRTATTWLLIFLVASFAIAAVGTIGPRYTTASYVITSQAGSIELGYTLAMCVLLDVLVLFAGYGMVRARRAAASKPTSLVP